MTIIYNFENTLMIKTKVQVIFEYNQFALLLYLPHSQNETNFNLTVVICLLPKPINFFGWLILCPQVYLPETR